jgi:hypothetical protein
LSDLVERSHHTALAVARDGSIALLEKLGRLERDGASES